jgi:hypothetical protein
MSSVVVELELELEEVLDVDDDEAPASVEPESPQAARPRGRARLRAAMVLRRASRMVWLLGRDCLTPGIRSCSIGRLGCQPTISALADRLVSR